MHKHEIFERLAVAAAQTIIDMLRDKGMTEQQVGEWLTVNFDLAYEWAEDLLFYSTTPEFKANVIGAPAACPAQQTAHLH